MEAMGRQSSAPTPQAGSYQREQLPTGLFVDEAGVPDLELLEEWCLKQRGARIGAINAVVAQSAVLPAPAARVASPATSSAAASLPTSLVGLLPPPLAVDPHLHRTFTVDSGEQAAAGGTPTSSAPAAAPAAAAWQQLPAQPSPPAVLPAVVDAAPHSTAASPVFKLDDKKAKTRAIQARYRQRQKVRLGHSIDGVPNSGTGLEDHCQGSAWTNLHRMVLLLAHGTLAETQVATPAAALGWCAVAAPAYPY